MGWALSHASKKLQATRRLRNVDPKDKAEVCHHLRLYLRFDPARNRVALALLTVMGSAAEPPTPTTDDSEDAATPRPELAESVR
jgi:hypothetical protein